MDKPKLISDKEWRKISSYVKITVARLRRRMPADWLVDDDELSSVCYDRICAILKSYKPGPRSPSSYCYEFLEQSTYSLLIAEYKRLKQQDTLFVMGELDDGDDDDYCPHKHGVAEVQCIAKFPADAVENKDLVGEIYNSCKDVVLRHAMACMYFLGYNLTDAARECKMSKQLLLHKLHTLGKKAL